MLYKTSFEQFKKLCQQSKRVVVSEEIYGDMLTPVRVFRALAEGQTDALMLDSSDHSTSDDACIYIGLDPIAEFTSKNGQITLTVNGQSEILQGDPFEALRQCYQRFRCGFIHSLAKFAGGMIGFMSYDAVRLIESIPDEHANEDGIPELCFKWYGANIAFDKRTGKILVAQVVDVGDDLENCYQQALQRNQTLINKILASGAPQLSTSTNKEIDPFANVEMDIDDVGYCNMVRKIRDFIGQGDAFQIVPSRRFRKKFKGDDFDVYRALRLLNPSPYQFYIRHQDYTIVGASPEKLISLQNGTVELTPIAGTRPRGHSIEEDQTYEKDLLADEKEIAEHMMLVDLGRNDVGTVSKAGSVNLASLSHIKRYSRVMHITSAVQGKLRDDCDVFDVLKAGFPAGTLTGAPKIRAMEIIDQVETSRRGLYGGAICAIDNEGNLDSCIAIRSAFIKDGMASVRAGAGVVYDSDPQKEADETRHKAQAVLDALALAEGGLV